MSGSGAGPAGRQAALLRAAVLALLASQLAFALWPALGEVSNDFANYYVPARMLRDGRDPARLYERDAFQAEVALAGIDRLASFVPHPPANALLLVPFAGLEPAAAKSAWTLLLAAAYALALPVLARAAGLGAWTAALVLLLPSASLANALAYGQPYPLLLALLAGALLLLLRGRDGLSGAALAPVLALKLYALPHAAFLAGARPRSAAALLLSLLAILAAGGAALGAEPHRVYLAEVLPWSLSGAVQDPYSPLWGSPGSLLLRLFRREPDLNPEPALDAPWLVAPLRAGLTALLLLPALAARPPGDAAARLRRRWALLTLAALAASPLTQSYHFVLLVLPVALLLGEGGSPARRAALLALLAFATSPLPHHLLGYARGFANPLAYTRLAAVLALYGLALRGALPARRALPCAALAIAAALAAPVGPGTQSPPDWQRLPEARGYLSAAPVACEGGWAWLSLEGGRYAVRHGDGRSWSGGAGEPLSPRCGADGRLRLERGGVAGRDADRDGIGLVRVAPGALIAETRGSRRELGRGRFRRPRLSPDGDFVAVESWEGGSWDIRVFPRAGGESRRATRSPANELEPAWTPDGRGLVFASDAGRGLGSTALYRVALR